MRFLSAKSVLSAVAILSVSSAAVMMKHVSAQLIDYTPIVSTLAVGEPIALDQKIVAIEKNKDGRVKSVTIAVSFKDTTSVPEANEIAVGLKTRLDSTDYTPVMDISLINLHQKEPGMMGAMVIVDRLITVNIPEDYQPKADGLKVKVNGIEVQVIDSTDITPTEEKKAE